MPSSFVFVTPTPNAAGNGLAQGLNAGASNDSAEDIFRKHFNPSSSIDTYEPGWDALIKAISAGDQTNFDNAALAVDQLWIHSASGVFLDRRAADQGVVRPDSVGISDEIFRRLAIKTTTKKVVTQSLLEAMEVYYGTDSTRANLTCADGPYALADGWEILISIDGGDAITVPVATEDFANINAATAQEVAAVISRWLDRNDSEAYALAYTSPLTGLPAVRIYSSALGLESSVQVTGGRAQNILQFPTLLTRSVPADVWVVTLPVPGTVRFTMSGATTTNLATVQEGDYVNIYGANFNAANQGSYSISSVDVRYVGGVLTQYFEIDLTTGVAQAAVAQITTSDLVFFRPTRATINDNGNRAVIVAQTRSGEVRVQLPATTIAVSRTAKTGAYANVNTAVEISSLVRAPNGTSTIITATNHGLTAGGQVLVDDIRSDGTVAAVTAGDGATNTDASVTTNLTDNVAAPAGTSASLIRSLLLSNGDVFSCGGEEYAATVDIGPVNSAHRLRITNPVVQPDTSIQYDYSWVATANMPVATNSHAIALLNGYGQAGNVLVCGGANGGGPFSTSYVYNTLNNTWSVSIPMGAARFLHTSTTLDDGRVLVCGGYLNFAFDIVDTAELFTAIAEAPGGAWTATNPMGVDRANHTATKLEDGRVLIIGGQTTVMGPTSTCEIFDPVTNTFSDTGSMGYVRVNHRAIALPNNRVFVWGGSGRLVSDPGSNAWLTSAEIYDANTGRWSPATRNPNRAVTALPYDEIAYIPSKNQVMVLGRTLPRIDLYDVATGKWLPSPTLVDIATEGVDYGSLTALQIYPIVVAMGGVDSSFTSVLGANLYIAAEDRIGSGGVNGRMHRVASVVNPTTFTIETPDYTSYLSDSTSDGTITKVAQAAAAANIPGPYIYDPDNGFSITGTSTLSTDALYGGTRYRRVGVTPGGATAFPDEEGWVIFGFGTAQQTAPIRYVGRENPDTLILDFKTVFPVDLPVGTSIILLDSKGPFVPEDPVDAGSFYVTDSPAGRVAASKTLDDIVAAGVSLVKTVVYPGDSGMGAEGFPVTGTKLSDKVAVWAGNAIDEELAVAKEG